MCGRQAVPGPLTCAAVPIEGVAADSPLCGNNYVKIRLNSLYRFCRNSSVWNSKQRGRCPEVKFCVGRLSSGLQMIEEYCFVLSHFSTLHYNLGIIEPFFILTEN